jgi:hypothetical protein
MRDLSGFVSDIIRMRPLISFSPFLSSASANKTPRVFVVEDYGQGFRPAIHVQWDRARLQTVYAL